VLGRKRIVLSPPQRRGGRWSFKFPVDYRKLLDEVGNVAVRAALGGYFWVAYNDAGSKPTKDKSGRLP